MSSDAGALYAEAAEHHQAAARGYASAARWCDFGMWVGIVGAVLGAAAIALGIALALLAA